MDSQDRIRALGAYLRDFPAASRRETAQQLLLESLLSTKPVETDSIHELASAMVREAPAGVERWIAEARLATELAEAEPEGIDLTDAALWAQDALHSLTEVSYQREALAAQLRYKLPRASSKQLHEEYVQYRVSFLAAVAAVALRQHQLEAAASRLEEAYRLQPLSGQVNALRGQLALARGDQGKALEWMERADALGALRQPWRDRELELFVATQHADAEALASQVDAIYRQLYPRSFTLPRRQLPSGGHPVLLELFTGSGCLPCAGPDLAVDTLLTSYGRQDLVLLEYDEHIPRPDPLANPDSVARATLYGIASTPTAFLDGEPLEVLGSSRADVQNIVIGFADAIEDRAMVPSGLQLKLSVAFGTGRLVSVSPAVAIAPAATVRGSETTGEISFRALSRAVLHVALVQDDVRYSGENGIRLHRMVVRSLQQGEVANYLGTAAARSFVFDPGTLAVAQTSYLASFERTNDRFGSFHFLATDIPFHGPFAVVAWVQDPGTRRVLQTVFAPVP